MKTIKNLQKPIEFDIHLKYRCKKCLAEHWLSFQETSTKNFKVVCYCGKVFKVKRTDKFKIKYCDDNLRSTTETTLDKNHNIIPVDLLEKTVTLLVDYGFARKEAIKLVEESYQKSPTIEYNLLVKQILTSLRK